MLKYGSACHGTLSLAPLLLGLTVAACHSSPATVVDAGVDRLSAPDQTLPDLVAQPDAPPALKVGEFLDFEASSSGKVVGSTSVGGSEKFIALLLSLDETARKTHAYSAQPSSSQPMHMPEGGGGPGSGLPRRRDFGEEVNAILRSKPAALWAPRPGLRAGVPPKVGDEREFIISSGTADLTITAECRFVDSVAAYWMDKTSTPAATLAADVLAQLADGFSKVALPRLRAYYGHESDVNGDGTISVLFSPLVSSGEGALAYVSPCDLLDPKLVPYCGGSNQMELLYVAPPQGSSSWASNPRILLETVSHEFQHAIYFYRKFIAHNQLSMENPYITEGLSGLAQDLSGYQLTLRMALGSTLQGVNQISAPDLTSNSVSSYVTDPMTNSYLYGGGYLLMRYLFDRAGGDSLDENGTPKDLGGMTWLRNVVDSKLTGIDNLAAASGLTTSELFTQFWTAMAVSNRGPSGAPICSDPKLNYRPTTIDPITTRQRGCSLFAPSQHSGGLTGPKTQPLANSDGVLRGGGAEFLLLSASEGQPRLGFTIETPPEARARVRLIRVQ